MCNFKVRFLDLRQNPNKILISFLFLPCLLLLFIPQLFVKPPQTTFFCCLCIFAFLFLWDGFGHCLLWRFWIQCWRRLLKIPLDCKIKPANPKGNQPWIFIGRTDAEDEAPILWPPNPRRHLIWKRPWCWERLKAKGEGDSRDEVVRQHHQLSRHEFEQTLGDTEGQGSVTCCSPWSYIESEMTKQLNHKKHR